LQSIVVTLTVHCSCHNLSAIQTTSQLDEPLLDQATPLAKAKGRDWSHFIEARLRDEIMTKLHVAWLPFFCLTTLSGRAFTPELTGTIPPHGLP